MNTIKNNEAYEIRGRKMEKKKINFELAKKAKGNAVGAFNKTKDVIAHAADQNDDGKFDFEDLSIVANRVGGVLKNKASALKDNAEERSRELELKTLQPIFEQTLQDENFKMPNFIRIVEKDKKRADSEVCKGSIGYYSDNNEIHIVNIFSDSISHFNLSFFPDESCGFYYVDPSDSGRYIAIDDYFGYLKVERISELQRLAQSLGAKHFKVTCKEDRMSSSHRIMKMNIDAKNILSGNTESNSSQDKFNTIEVAADMACPGHAPNEPQLKYLKNDPAIKALISMRMDEHSPLTHQKFMLKLSNSSGLKENDAVKIEAALKSIKFKSGGSVVKEARNESHRYFEYEIEF